MSPVSPSNTYVPADIPPRLEVHSSLASAPLRAVAIETGLRPIGSHSASNDPSDFSGQALGPVNGTMLSTVEDVTTPPLASAAPVTGHEDGVDPGLELIELRNGALSSHGHGHGHNGRARDEFDLDDVATFLAAPLVTAGFGAPGAAAVAVPARPASPAIPSLPTGVYARFGKRALDLLGGIGVLLLAGPVVLLAALAVKLTSRGPAFYASTRLGKNGRPFRFYTLRSLSVGAAAERARLMHLNEVDGPVFKLRRDPRVTRVGQWLRSTSIDELPQLLNVLKGDMSLVGPRPPLPEEADRYEAWQRRRLDVKPGITCLWQVSGRSRLSFEEWMRLDLEYIRRQSLATDLWILLRTIPAVLSREGAY